jgi:hypothetical protein
MWRGVTCMVRGEPIAMKWLQEHRKWVLSGWRCKFGEPDKETRYHVPAESRRKTVHPVSVIDPPRECAAQKEALVPPTEHRS